MKYDSLHLLTHRQSQLYEIISLLRLFLQNSQPLYDEEVRRLASIVQFSSNDRRPSFQEVGMNRVAGVLRF